MLDRDALDYMRAQGLPQTQLGLLEAQGEQVFADEDSWRAALEAMGITSERHVRIATEGALNKLVGFNDEQRAALEAKRTQIWDFYAELKSYKQAPTAEKKAELNEQFDEIFTQKTCFADGSKNVSLEYRNAAGMWSFPPMRYLRKILFIRGVNDHHEPYPLPGLIEMLPPPDLTDDNHVGYFSSLDPWYLVGWSRTNGFLANAMQPPMNRNMPWILVVAMITSMAACSRHAAECQGEASEKARPGLKTQHTQKVALAELLHPDDAWPEVPAGTTAEGARWQTIRHETIHVHLLLPAAAKVKRSTLSFGHPVVWIELKEVTVEITFSSGAGVFGHGLAQDPPNVVGLPVIKIAKSPDNTTVHYLRRGEPVVKGWVRGAECSASVFRPEQVEPAFILCASMRVPRPGPLVKNEPAATKWPLRAVPSEAIVARRYEVPVMYAGHFVAKALRQNCPTNEEIRAKRSNEDFTLEAKTYPNGSLLISRDWASYDGVRFRSTTAVWATRDNHCCIATIAESLTAPTLEQIDYVTRLCDGVDRTVREY